MDASFWAVILLLLAGVLLFAEILIPSGGLIFFAAMICLAGAVWSAWTAWWVSYPVLWWLFVASVIILLPSSVGAAVYVWPYTPMGRKSEPPTEEEVTPYQAEYQRLSKLIGHVGKTMTPLTPAGITLVEGQRVHCYSEGMSIPSGVPVRVLAVNGNRVLVREVHEFPAESQHSETKQNPSVESTGEDALLDFDVPSS